MGTRSCRGNCGRTVSGAWWCDACKRARGKQPTRYGGAYRAKLAQRYTAVGTACVRCGHKILSAADASPDHDDNDPSR
ncbi:MAG TPA: hypothetical protein VIV12_27490, partial [Streptosporangiaceae bacterium]